MINWNKLTEFIDSSSDILLSTHRDPDGDGLGSVVAMYYYLKSINKNVRIINISKTPGKYKFLDKENVIQSFTPDLTDTISSSDLLMVFDLGDFDRLGEIGDIVIQNNIDVVNIDHHIPRDNSMYALSIVNQKSPSTTYMLWKYFGEMGLNDKPLTDEIALALYAGLVNDTGSFRYNAVTSDTHVMASHMLESKVNPNAVFSHIYENRSISKIHLLSEMINNIEFLDNNKVAYVVINDDIFNKLPYTDDKREFTYFRMEDFYNFCKRNHWEIDKVKTGNLLKRLEDIFVEEERIRVKNQQPRLIKIKAMKKLMLVFLKLNIKKTIFNENNNFRTTRHRENYNFIKLS